VKYTQTIGSFPIGRPFIGTVVLPAGFTVTKAEVTPAPEQLTVPTVTVPFCDIRVMFTATGDPNTDSTGTRAAIMALTAVGSGNVADVLGLKLLSPP
jgi:hypothetical protein